MLKHVVFFKFKKDAPDSAIAEVEKELGGLPSAIPEIREFVFGRDVIHSERSYDLALVSSFDGMDELNRYQVHPAHKAVVVKIRAIAESILAVDFYY